ncbi:hypothetical protein B0H21DRAFT_894291 [Amylocystis lapponica]|nr:hypothetical protein B0H21DRAFT_894291 [Amylocystis lapponica]
MRKDSSPSACPHLSSNALDELQYDLTTLLHQTLAHLSLHPPNLGILPHKNAWLLSLDAAVLTDAGNVVDALLMAACAALWYTRSRKRVRCSTDEEARSGFDTRDMARTAADFKLPDYWDEGEISPLHFLDATPSEEASTPLRLILAVSFPPDSPSSLQAMRLLRPAELALPQIKSLLADGEKYAQGLFAALEAKLQDEDVRRNIRMCTFMIRLLLFAPDGPIPLAEHAESPTQRGTRPG